MKPVGAKFQTQGTIWPPNLRIRNSAVTEFVFTPKQHMLLSFNHLPFLDAAERRGWVSYS